MYCKLLIPSSCGVCRPTLTVSRSGRVVDTNVTELLSRGTVMRLYLPQEAINSMMTVFNLARWQMERDDKVAQFEAQVEHMFKAYSKDPDIAHALRTLACLICLREQDSAQMILSTFFQPGAAIFARKAWFEERVVEEGESVGWLAWMAGWHRCVQTVHQRWTTHKERAASSDEESEDDIVKEFRNATTQTEAAPKPWSLADSLRLRGGRPVSTSINTKSEFEYFQEEMLTNPESYRESFARKQQERFGVPVPNEEPHENVPLRRTDSQFVDDEMFGPRDQPPPLPPPPGLPQAGAGTGLFDDDDGYHPANDKALPTAWKPSLRPRSAVDLDNPNAVKSFADNSADQHAMDEMLCDSASLESMTMHPPPHLARETPLDGGERIAERRGPHLGPKPYFFSNAGDNLIMAKELRDNGDAGPVRVSEFSELLEKASDSFNRIVLCENQCRNLRVKEACEEFPKKYTCKERERYVKDMWYCNAHSLPPKISTSIKSEVVSKEKPRPIQAHNTERLALNCPLLGTYERILKARCGRYTIKGRVKQNILYDMCCAADDLSKRGDGGQPIYPLMFDQTAFEFGINDDFKAAEAKMLTKVAELLGSEYAIYPDDLVDKCIAERQASIDWVMQCKDGRGFRFKHVIKMLTTMRQSGDRGTSSLNWFANALWVCVSLCLPGSYDEFWREMLKGNHRGHFSFPAWDGMGRITLVLNMEGDDLLGWSTREDCADRMVKVAHAVGWKAKDELQPMNKVPVCNEVGQGHVTYVGYHVYTLNNVPCAVDGDFVMFPELKRFLTTKAWSTTVLDPSERAACEVLNYMVYAQSFKHLKPMADLCRALANGWRTRHEKFSGIRGPAPLKVTSQAVIRDAEFRTGQILTGNDVNAFLRGTESRAHHATDSPYVTEKINAVALAMSSHVCGHEWGLVGADDILDLIGMVELEPLCFAADLRCRVPLCWWQK